MLKKVVLAVGLIAIPLNRTGPTTAMPTRMHAGNRERRHALNASDCANLGRAESGGNKTCRGYITSNCVQDR
jgi:hypothetical protein